MQSSPFKILMHFNGFVDARLFLLNTSCDGVVELFALILSFLLVLVRSQLFKQSQILYLAENR
jgi:hypothetical protein